MGSFDKLGPALRQLRRRRGLTIRRLAERSRLSHTAVSRYETGQRRPSLKNLEAMLSGLETNLVDLWWEMERLAGRGGHDASQPLLELLARKDERIKELERQLVEWTNW